MSYVCICLYRSTDGSSFVHIFAGTNLYAFVFRLLGSRRKKVLLGYGSWQRKKRWLKNIEAESGGGGWWCSKRPIIFSTFFFSFLALGGGRTTPKGPPWLKGKVIEGSLIAGSFIDFPFKELAGTPEGSPESTSQPPSPTSLGLPSWDFISSFLFLHPS
jgi:hypothetical protein